MTLQQLNYFVAIQQYGGFIAAAEELYISQSSLSKSIMALEKELQVKLFIRNSRTTKLSASGEQLLPYAIEITKNYNRIMDICEHASIQKEHLIVVGGIPVLNQYKVTDAILRFERKHMAYQTEVIETTTREVFKGILNYTIDVGLVFLKLPLEMESEDFLIYPLLEDRVVLIGSIDNPVMRKHEIYMKDLKDQVFIQNNKDVDLVKNYTNEIRKNNPGAIIHLNEISAESMNRYIIAKQWVSLSMEKIADNLFDMDVDTAVLKDGMKMHLCAVLNNKRPSKKGLLLYKFLKAFFA